MTVQINRLEALHTEYETKDSNMFGPTHIRYIFKYYVLNKEMWNALIVFMLNW